MKYSKISKKKDNFNCIEKVHFENGNYTIITFVDSDCVSDVKLFNKNGNELMCSNCTLDNNMISLCYDDDIYDIMIEKGGIKMNMNNYIYKFTDTTKTIEDLKDSNYYKMLVDCMNNDYTLLKEKSKDIYYRNLFKDGCLKLQGYIFDFRPFLNKYLVQFKYNKYYLLCYSLNKTCLYNQFGRHNITDIVEKK